MDRIERSAQSSTRLIVVVTRLQYFEKIVEDSELPVNVHAVQIAESLLKVPVL